MTKRNIYIGCYVEMIRDKLDNMPPEWAVCWPDCTVLERGFSSKRSAESALSGYQRAIA